MKYLIKLMSLIALMAVAQLTYSAPITDTYTKGDTLTAGTLNNIKSVVNDIDTRATVLETDTDDLGTRTTVLETGAGDLDTRIAAIEGGIDIAVDCSADVNAFLNITIKDNTTYTLTGMCNGPIWVENRKNVTIQGDATGSKDDGVILPAGLTVQPYAAIGIWQSNSIILDNLTVSAANYVSEAYAFGDNASAVHVGNKSYTDVSNVDFIGGDYSVHVYNGGQLNVKEGVTVTGFNLGGLTAYNHGLIRTLNDITVTGLVGASTQDDSNAIQATNNGIVEIRGGGSFAGPTVAVQDYRTTIWASDNGTVRIKNSTNPTVVTGGIASWYSAMIRIEGNTTVNGYVAAYHMGYTRLSDTTQTDGLIEVGDGGYLRFESSAVTPTSILYPTFPIDIYRMGKLRLNNTSINLGGNKIVVSGFGLLNLRGTTDLGGDGIDCHESRLVSIKSTVTNVGPISCKP